MKVNVLRAAPLQRHPCVLCVPFFLAAATGALCGAAWALFAGGSWSYAAGGALIGVLGAAAASIALATSRPDAGDSSEARAAAVFEALPLPAYVQDSETRRLLAVNSAAVAVYGYSREELTGMTSREFAAPEARDAPAVADATAGDSGHGAALQVHLTRDARRLTMHVERCPMRYGARPATLCIAVDITDRVREQLALRESEGRLRSLVGELRENEQRYRALFEQAAVGVTVCDLDLRYEQVNDRFCEMTGYRREELMRMSVRDVSFPQYSGETVAGRRPAAATGDAEGALRFDLIRRKDGSTLWISSVVTAVRDANGDAQRYIAVIQDVTDQKSAEDALHAQRAFLRQVIDLDRSFIFVKNREGRFMLVNRALADAYGTSVEALSGARATDFDSNPGEGEESRRDDLEVMDSLQEKVIPEETFTDATGRVRWLRTVKRPIPSSEGRADMVLAVATDITDQKRHVEELARFNAELEARVAERTAQLERVNRDLEAFTYSVSHDLRAPLRAMEGFSERVLEECTAQLGPRAAGFLARVLSGSRRMTRLIDNLLELSHTGRREVKRGRVDVSQLARELIAEIRETEPERAVNFIVQAGIIADADSELLRIVLDNLLRNAWKFTGGRGEARIELGCEQRAGASVYFVRDNGAGFDLRRAQRLFTPFQRLHGAAEFPGTGIGLAMAQRVVRRHGGEIWAQAAVDEGATFYFTLDPAGACLALGGPPAAPPRPGEVVVEPRQAGGRSAADSDRTAVLVVDDDEDTLKVLCAELERDGHAVLSAPDARSGLEIMRQQGRIGVVVTDYSMPGMNGSEFLGVVRSSYPGTVRILVTGHADARVLAEAVNTGRIHHFVDKEWDRVFLRACVRQALNTAAQRP